MSTNNIDLDVRLGRKETAAALTAHGFPIAEATLATMASRGGGPPFSRFGSRVVYKWGDALAWANARLIGPATSTSAFQLPYKQSTNRELAKAS
jgi:hypothetical protein